LTETNSSTTDLQNLIESILGSIAGELNRRPTAVVIEAPAHFPPLAIEESETTAILVKLLKHVLIWTSRQEIIVHARVVPTEGLPQPFRDDESKSGEGPWALLSITDHHALKLPDLESETSAFPNQAELKSIFETIQQILGNAGGDVWFESIEREGIQIWIVLPLQAENHDQTDVTRIRETVDERLREGSQTNAKLLLQAENDELRSMLAGSLIRAGYDVISTKRTPEVLPLARRDGPDLIIIDLQSRNPSAMDLALMLKGEPELTRTPILFLTEIAGPGIGRRMDTVDFIVQPEGANAILQTVDQVLSSRLRPAERIMVVEPDDTLREEMLMTIQAQGFPVVEARSPEEALALAERVKIRVVLAQARLAQERDFWLVRQLRQLSMGIEIYLMTEGEQPIDASLAMRRGATGYGDTGRLRDLLDQVEDHEKKKRDEG
jgi:DNA-binding response OmpR family regulator